MVKKCKIAVGEIAMKVRKVRISNLDAANARFPPVTTTFYDAHNL